MRLKQLEMPKPPERIPVQRLRFLGEQKGDPETLLKERLADFLRHENTVTRAYLVRAEVGDEKNISVILGLRASLEPRKPVLANLASIFASVFDAKEHLDIMFLTDEQEGHVAGVCGPFFERK